MSDISPASVLDQANLDMLLSPFIGCWLRLVLLSGACRENLPESARVFSFALHCGCSASFFIHLLPLNSRLSIGRVTKIANTPAMPAS